MPRENWFFAFPLDGSFVTDLPEPPQGFRRYHPDDVHLTIAFLGGVGEESALRALGVLDERLPELQLAPFDVWLGDVCAMGSSRAYSALSVLLGRGRVEAESLMGTLRDPLTLAANGRREQRRPKAHITIARPGRRAGSGEREQGLAWAKALDLSQISRRLDRIALYRWSENRRERLFRIAAERALG